jgi:RNA polymerase sigma-70 factor (ECF subfamily)
MLPTLANGQPAAVTYRRDAGGIYHAYGIVVLGVTDASISNIVGFGEPRLVARFVSPTSRPATASGPPAASHDR